MVRRVASSLLLPTLQIARNDVKRYVLSKHATQRNVNRLYDLVCIIGCLYPAAPIVVCQLNAQLAKLKHVMLNG